MTTFLNLSPDRVEALAFENPGCVVEVDDKGRLHVRVGRDHYVSTPLPVMGLSGGAA